MLIANLELNHQAKLPAGHTLAAFFQEIGTWQKLLARLHTHRSELPIEFEQFENADETIHEEFAHSDPGNSLVFRLLPGVRCSA